MITISTDTLPEYLEMLKFAKNYVCKRIGQKECGKYPLFYCEKCYMDHHIKCGIHVIEPVDKPEDD